MNFIWHLLHTVTLWSRFTENFGMIHHGKTHELSTGPFSIAMLNYQRVAIFLESFQTHEDVVPFIPSSGGLVNTYLYYPFLDILVFSGFKRPEPPWLRRSMSSSPGGFTLLWVHCNEVGFLADHGSAVASAMYAIRVSEKWEWIYLGRTLMWNMINSGYTPISIPENRLPN